MVLEVLFDVRIYANFFLALLPLIFFFIIVIIIAERKKIFESFKKSWNREMEFFDRLENKEKGTAGERQHLHGWLEKR